MEVAPKLSILIPYRGDSAALEATLVSVLENRPSRSEILVALGSPYADPYHLADEITFIAAGDRASLAELLNLGLRRSRAQVLHVLMPGCEATPGWTEAALAPLETQTVATVSPLVRSAADDQRVLALGVAYGRGGQRKVVGGGLAVEAAREWSTLSIRSIGPTLSAGFYRAADLRRLGGWDGRYGDELVDIDLALRLRAAGKQTVCVPTSVVVAAPRAPTTPGACGRSRAAERLFWKHVSGRGLAASIIAHVPTVLADMARRPIAATFGRMLGLFDSLADRRGPSQDGAPGQSRPASSATVPSEVVGGKRKLHRADAAQAAERKPHAQRTPADRTSP
jgi:hypothetical protein